MIENIKVFVQNSIRIESEMGVIYVDPFKMEGEPKDADYIFVTHDHYDHFSPDDIKKVACEKTNLVVPAKMEKKVVNENFGVSRIMTVKPGASYEVNGLKFETVAMYNIMKPFHPKSSEWSGYVITANGKRVYIAGDIDLIKEAREVKCDIAMVPIGGFYTMDAQKAAELINEIKPEVAIPVHYDSEVGRISDGGDFARMVKEPVKVEIMIKG